MTEKAQQPVHWVVVCNGARWPSSFKTIRQALVAIGQLSERSNLTTDKDWVIEIVRRK